MFICEYHICPIAVISKKESYFPDMFSFLVLRNLGGAGKWCVLNEYRNDVLTDLH